MIKWVTGLSLVCAAWISMVVSQAQVCATCPSFAKTPSPPIKSLSALVGCWKGKGPNGLASKISYEMGSDYTALLETMWIENNPTMYTMYYLVDGTAMAHHFCSYGNQLIMRAALLNDPNVLPFKLVDSTNLPSEHNNHVFSITFHFRDNDHFEVEWGLHHNSRDLPQRYVFMRVAQGCTARPDEW
jgi:hypothetical protein